MTADSRFQSTLPARGATTCSTPRSGSAIISIHAPRTGSDLLSEYNTVTGLISIHAPRTGSDLLLLRRFCAIFHFNPRSPHGERLNGLIIGMINYNFNPRSPHGERPDLQCCCYWQGIFQSTLPARGATRRSRLYKGTCAAFQSTLPARGATKAQRQKGASQWISIHAPRTGSDQKWKDYYKAQSISIHAPRTGSDCAK